MFDEQVFVQLYFCFLSIAWMESPSRKQKIRSQWEESREKSERTFVCVSTLQYPWALILSKKFSVICKQRLNCILTANWILKRDNFLFTLYFKDTNQVIILLLFNVISWQKLTFFHISWMKIHNCQDVVQHLIYSKMKEQTEIFLKLMHIQLT